MNQDELRKIPSVDDLLESSGFPERFPRSLRKEVVSGVLERIRERVKSGNDCPDTEDIRGRIEDEARQLWNNRVRSVINATGVVLHTNLGRAPYSEETLEVLTDVIRGYSSLEIDVSTGERGGRGYFGERLLCRMTEAESAGIVNNCSGALVLALKAIARGKDVLISRGELVQIGGGFRIPEVLEASGSNLREVGTTNKTALSDYEQAMDEDVGMILRVHRSNFDLVGFTGSPSDEDLSELASDAGIPYVSDLGSGALWDTSTAEIRRETMPGDVLETGANLVTFSGDKLLGGPQSGMFLGDQNLVEQMKDHPFFRALRCGKATLAALEATLMAYAQGDENSLPAVRQLRESPEQQKQRVESVYRELGEPQKISVESMEGTVGGGSLPSEVRESWGLAIDVEDPEAFLGELRTLEPPVVGRIRNDSVQLNFRSVLPKQESMLIDGIVTLL